MFDHESMATSRLEQVRTLQARVRQIEDTRAVETHEVLPALEPLFAGRGLRAGAAYTVEGSTMLAMAMIAGASAAGSWCGVVGVPAFGAEAAAALGVTLERTVLVPDPGEHWIAVLTALIDVLPVVVVRPPDRVRDGDGARILARLRQHDATLVALDSWPRSEARLSIDDSSWLGLGAGYGHLCARRATVTAYSRTGRPRTARLWLPGFDNRVELIEGAPEQASTGVGPAPAEAERAAS